MKQSTRSPSRPRDAIHISYVTDNVTLSDSVSVTLAIPGYCGVSIGRSTLPEALRALADYLDTLDARRPTPVGTA